MPKPFADTLRLLQNGALQDEAAAKLAELITSVESTGKAGTLTLKIDVKQQGAALSITSHVTAKIPEPKQVPDVLWSTVEGNLTQANPKQQNLELRSIDKTEPEPLRNVG